MFAASHNRQNIRGSRIEAVDCSLVRLVQNSNGWSIPLVVGQSTEASIQHGDGSVARFLNLCVCCVFARNLKTLLIPCYVGATDEFHFFNDSKILVTGCRCHRQQFVQRVLQSCLEDILCGPFFNGDGHPNTGGKGSSKATLVHRGKILELEKFDGFLKLRDKLGFEGRSVSKGLCVAITLVVKGVLACFLLQVAFVCKRQSPLVVVATAASDEISGAGRRRRCWANQHGRCFVDSNCIGVTALAFSVKSNFERKDGCCCSIFAGGGAGFTNIYHLRPRQPSKKGIAKFVANELVVAFDVGFVNGIEARIPRIQEWLTGRILYQLHNDRSAKLHKIIDHWAG